MSSSLLLAHGLLAISQKASFSLDDWPSRYAAMGFLAIAGIMLLSLCQLRRLSYELFLRLHQLLSFFFVFCVVKHLESAAKKNWTWLPVVIFAGSFCVMFALQLVLIVFRNKAWHEPCPRMVIRQKHGVVEATLNLPRPIRFQPGQYIVVWVPSIGLFESHPFMVTSWSPGGQKRIRLLIEPRRGFTDKLLRRSDFNGSEGIAHRAFFSGPHGKSTPATECKAVVIFAEGNGLAAVISHVKRLIHYHKTGKGRTKRIHLIWLVHSEDEIKAKEEYINEILVDDGLENGYIFRCSIRDTSAMFSERFGKHGRVFITPEKPDTSAILDSERTGRFIVDWHRDMAEQSADQRKQEAGQVGQHFSWNLEDEEYAKLLASRFREAGGRTLVLVSAGVELRDRLRRDVRKHLSAEFELEELEYQPS